MTNFCFRPKKRSASRAMYKYCVNRSVFLSLQVAPTSGIMKYIPQKMMRSRGDPTWRFAPRTRSAAASSSCWPSVPLIKFPCVTSPNGAKSRATLSIITTPTFMRWQRMYSNQRSKSCPSAWKAISFTTFRFLDPYIEHIRQCGT